MIIDGIFVFSLVVTLMNVLLLLSIMVDNKIVYPGNGLQRPSHWFWFYPSALYQGWYWSTYFALI